MAERMEWDNFGALLWTPLGDGRRMIEATCYICHWTRRRYTASGARRALRRHWALVPTAHSGDSDARV